MTLSVLAFGLFVLTLGFSLWKPGPGLARWAHYLIWMGIGAAALVGLLGGLFTVFWPPTMHWAIVWSCATLVALVVVAASNRSPPGSELIP